MDTREIDVTKLKLLLEGIDVVRRRHRYRHVHRVAGHERQAAPKLWTIPRSRSIRIPWSARCAPFQWAGKTGSSVGPSWAPGRSASRKACWVTCRLHDIDPYDYLVDVLQRVGQRPASRVHALTPRLWKQHFAQAPLRSDLYQIDARRGHRTH